MKKLHDYIKHHNLVLKRRVQWPEWNVFADWVPMEFVPPHEGHRITFEIYSNAADTHFVSLDITNEQFRIIHREVAEIVSEWQPLSKN